MIKVYLKNGKVLEFKKANSVTIDEDKNYIIKSNNVMFAKFEKDAIIGVSTVYPDTIFHLLSDNEEQIKILNESINNLIIDYEKRLSQQQEIMRDMEHKIEGI